VRKHDLDLTSLIAGIVFVVIAAAYLVGVYTDVHIGAGWVLPVALIGLGAAGLAGSVRRGLRRTPPAPDQSPDAQDVRPAP
jgi:hypothetical protein